MGGDASTPQAVVFDVGRVLFAWDLAALYEKLIDDPARLEWFVAEVVSEDWHYAHDRGEPLAELIEARIAEYPDEAGLIRAYAKRFSETIYAQIAGTHSIVRELAARGVPIFGLTNFAVSFWADFRPTQPIFDLFEDIVVSGVEKCAKPDPAIYALAEERFGLSGGQLFFTDDSPANIAAARVRGWQAHRFLDAERLRATLEGWGLLGAP